MEKRHRRHIPLTERDFVVDMTRVSGLPITFVSGAVDALFDYITGSLKQQRAVRIMGVGLLFIEKQTTGSYIGMLKRAPGEVSAAPIVKRDAIIQHLVKTNGCCPDPTMTFSSLWTMFCDLVQSKLKYGYEINLRDVGVIVPGSRGPKDAAWYLTPLQQSRLAQLSLERELRDCQT